MLYIGIDPALGDTNGVAIWSGWEKRFRKIFNMDWVKLVLFICEANPDSVRLFIEDPSGNKPVFPKKLDKKSVRVSLKIAQDIGMNKGAAKLMIRYFRAKGYNVTALVPNKNSGTKMDEEEFKRITKYTKKTTPHGRDAAMLVFKR